MKQQRLLGLDIGERHIGIAVSDPLGLTAQPYQTYRRASREEDLAFFKDLADQYNVTTVVCGLPLNMDDSESAQTRRTKNYAGFLKNALGLENVIYIDERLTTMEAGDILNTGGVRGRKKRKEKIDTIAAQIILQTYMNTLKE